MVRGGGEGGGGPRSIARRWDKGVRGGGQRWFKFFSHSALAKQTSRIIYFRFSCIYCNGGTAVCTASQAVCLVPFSCSSLQQQPNVKWTMLLRLVRKRKLLLLLLLLLPTWPNDE